MRAGLLRLLLGALLSLPSCGAVATATPPGPGSRPLWPPPGFDPTSSAPAADLLEERLADFERANPGLVVVVRVKDESGPPGLTETLSAGAGDGPGRRQ